MLTASYCFAPGITEDLERTLWQQGVLNWDILRKHRDAAVGAIGDARTKKLVAAVNEAEEAWKAGDYAWFSKNWPKNETWRLWRGYCESNRVALMDIETTGRTPGFDQITVIGCSDGTEELAFVADRPLPGDLPLEDYLETLRQKQLLVTFNGIGFDVPFIEKHFREHRYVCDHPHIDLMLVARSLGLTGGLKDMEKELGIGRDSSIQDMRGNEAIILWGAWKNGDRSAYERLVTYCKADCTNLAKFADICYERKWDQVYTKFARELDLDAMFGEQTSLF